MGDYSNDAYMEWSRSIQGTRTSVILAVDLARGAINLSRFLLKMHQQNLLSGNEIDNYFKFLKATNGDFDIQRVPLKVNGDTVEDIDKLKKALKEANISYHYLPNFNDGYNCADAKVGSEVIFKSDPEKKFEITAMNDKEITFQELNPNPKFEDDKFVGDSFKMKNNKEALYKDPFKIANARDPQKAAYFAVYSKDKEKFNQIFMEHIKTELCGGEKEAEDIRNFTNGRATVFSVPDETCPQMEEAMKRMNVSFSKIGGDLTPYHTQYIIPNSDVSNVKYIYQTLRDDLKRDGSNIGNIEFHDSPDSMLKKTEMSTDDYIDNNIQNDKCMDAFTADTGEKTESARELDRELTKEGRSTSLACRKFYQNPEYMQLSLDGATLIHNPKDRLLYNVQGENPEVFACRVPGTYKDNEQILILPRDQVFSVEGSERERYIAFLKNDEPPVILFKGAQNTDMYADAPDLYRMFDTKGKSPAFNPENLKELEVGELSEGWKEAPPENASMSDKKNNFKDFKSSRSYTKADYDDLERKLLDASFNNVPGEAAKDIVEDTASNVVEESGKVLEKGLGI